MSDREKKEQAEHRDAPASDRPVTYRNFGNSFANKVLHALPAADRADKLNHNLALARLAQRSDDRARRQA